MKTELSRYTALGLIAQLFYLGACSPSSKEREEAEVFSLQATEWEAPGEESARFPRLAQAGLEADRIYLSWLNDGAEPALQLASFLPSQNRWQALPTAIQDSNLFVNWADYPQLSVDAEGQLSLQYLKVNDPALPYAYHIWQTQLPANATTWSPPYRLHQDSSNTEHGFISSVSFSTDSLATIWLDGRKYAAGQAHQHQPGGEGGEMSLRFRATASDSRLGPARELDGRTCDCCNTALAALPGGGLIAAYRDRSPDEVRDIYFTRYQQQQWTPPQPIATDEWQVYGCPVNGPALASREDKVALAWYTGAKGGRVQLRLSPDGGSNWGKVLVADSLKPIGRVQVGWLKSTLGLISWVNQQGELRVQAFNSHTLLNHPLSLASGLSDRKTGFPQMISRADTAYLAWTHPEGGIRLRKLFYAPN